MSIVDCLQDAQDVEGARAADEEVTTQLVDNKLTPHMETSSGTVACLGSVKGADMWIANLGDCRNVLSKDGTALAISGDYAPEENAAEAEQFADLRSSCFRDCMSKFRVATLTLRSTWPYREPSGTCVSAEAHVAEGCRYSHSSKFEGISSEPEAFSAKIDGAVDFVIIGTDGIWDALKEQLGLTHARKALRTAAKPEDAAAAILQSAGKVSKSDNSAVIVVMFKFPELLPKRPGVPRVSLTQLQETELQTHVRLVPTQVSPATASRKLLAPQAASGAAQVALFKFPEPLPKRPGVPRVSLTQLQETPA